MDCALKINMFVLVNLRNSSVYNTISLHRKIMCDNLMKDMTGHKRTTQTKHSQETESGQTIMEETPEVQELVRHYPLGSADLFVAMVRYSCVNDE